MVEDNVIINESPEDLKGIAGKVWDIANNMENTIQAAIQKGYDAAVDEVSKYKAYVDEQFGDVGEALDKINDIQNSLISGDVECAHDIEWKPYDDFDGTTMEAQEIGVCKNEGCPYVEIRNRAFYANLNDGIRNTNTSAQGRQKVELGSYTTVGDVDLSFKCYVDYPTEKFKLNPDALMNIFGYMGINNGTFSRLWYKVTYNDGTTRVTSAWKEAYPTNGRASAVIYASGNVQEKCWAAIDKGNISCEESQIKDINGQVDLTQYRGKIVMVTFAVEVDAEYLVQNSQDKYITFLRVSNVEVPGGMT